VWDVVEPIQALIRGGVAVDPELLADPDIPIESLVDMAGPSVGSLSFFSRLD
jgi:hypothetical protein